MSDSLVDFYSYYGEYQHEEKEDGDNNNICLHSSGYFKTWYPHPSSSSTSTSTSIIQIPNDAIQPIIIYFLKAFLDVDTESGRKINERRKKDYWGNGDTPLIEVVRNRSVDEASMFMLVEAYPEYIFNSTTSIRNINNDIDNRNNNKIKNNNDRDDNGDKELEFDVNAPNKKGDTALHIAARYGCYDVVKYLIDRAGAKVNLRNECAMTPLHSACYSRQALVVKLLLDRGVDVNATNTDGDTALHFASRLDILEIVKCLVRYGVDVDVDSANNSRFTPLHMSCIHGHVSIVKFLLDNGARRNVTDLHGNTPLNLASYYGYLEIVKRLLGYGVDDACVNLAADNGTTPLHLACRKGHESIVKILLSGGADIHRRTDNGNTPLHFVSMSLDDINETIATLLIEKGADLDPINNFGSTPLLCGVESQHDRYRSECEKFINTLIGNGAKTKFFFKRIGYDAGDLFELGNEDDEDVVAAKVQHCSIRNKHIFVPVVGGDNEQKMIFSYRHPARWEMVET